MPEHPMTNVDGREPLTDPLGRPLEPVIACASDGTPTVVWVPRNVDARLRAAVGQAPVDYPAKYGERADPDPLSDAVRDGVLVPVIANYTESHDGAGGVILYATRAVTDDWRGADGYVCAEITVHVAKGQADRA
jgi:hypothetical protein